MEADTVREKEAPGKVTRRKLMVSNIGTAGYQNVVLQVTEFLHKT
jgi:hypothetical protein